MHFYCFEMVELISNFIRVSRVVLYLGFYCRLELAVDCDNSYIVFYNLKKIKYILIKC